MLPGWFVHARPGPLVGEEIAMKDGDDGDGDDALWGRVQLGRR